MRRRVSEWEGTSQRSREQEMSGVSGATERSRRTPIGGWTRLLVGIPAVVVVAFAAACSGGAAPVGQPTSRPAAAATVPDGAPTRAPSAAITPARELTGAGATFPYPLYSKWFDVYSQKTGIKINYQSIGSGGGIRQLIEGTVDFAGSDATMTEEQIKQAGGGDVLHIPTVMGAVVVIYNVEGVETGLRLTPEALSGIFLGEIKKWNDPRITANNGGIKLPDAPIAVVHRSDGSGTTSIFTDYLSSVSANWKSKVGKGTSVNWPVGLGAKGNEGVAGQVKQTPGSVGYVELAYAIQNRLTYASLENQAGKFVEASIDSTTAAAAGAAPTMPDNLRVSLVNAPGEDSYPIAGFTWLLVHREQRDGPKGKALADMVWWGIHDGQRYASDLLYAPLPPEVVAKAEKMVKSMIYQGQVFY